MSDDGDSGYDDGGAQSGSSVLHGRSANSTDLSVLRRAMRWETLAILVILVVLAAAAS
ncbi:hypothetical protein AB0G60_02050 [Streptomyces angustmyceticus]|uniref:hypothetical protein n=1 Tax=Streptomyces angustmyceticus TaxID=285578 RepID=UPI001CBCE316|nr:hypothetical protein [Streptomyces angustmyceticus]